jgi:DNA-binding MarR family transcriptional regulator
VANKNNKSGAWAMVFQEKLLELSENRDFKWQHWRVFTFLIGHLSYESFTPLRQAFIGERLGMGRSNISRLISELAVMQLVQKRYSRENGFEYRLNPDYAFKGAIKKLSMRKKKEK